MKLISRLSPLCSVRSMFGLVALLVPAGLLSIDLLPTAGAHNNTEAVQALSRVVAASVRVIDKVNPAAVAGSKSCVDCHKSELSAWMESKHHGSLKKIQEGANIAKYARAAGITVSDVMKDSLCAKCHATPQGQGANAHAISGVSCESCHGGSAGNPEWLKLHAKTDAASRNERELACEKAGMIRAGNLYRIAKNCFECHIVTQEELVNAGHPVWLKIELVGSSSGEVRHNFQVDQKVNAEAPSLLLSRDGGTAVDRRRVKFIVGTLVDLEVTLSNLMDVPKANGKKPFAKGNAKRLKSTKKVLDKMVKVLGKKAPTQIVDAQQAIDDMGRISSFNFKSQAKAEQAAPVVAKAAQSFAANADGSSLGGLDALIKKTAKPVGTVYSP